MAMLEASEFDRYANTPSVWFGVADTLLKSAALIWTERRSIPHSAWVAIMLRGHAVENLLKGLWIQHKGELTKGGKFVNPPGGARHDLPLLARSLGVPMDESREFMLGALSNAIRSLGRYPIPLNRTEFAVHELHPDDPSKDRVDKANMWSPAHEREFWKLIAELAGEFEFLKKLPTRWLGDVLESWRDQNDGRPPPPPPRDQC